MFGVELFSRCFILDTGRKLNTHKMFIRRPGGFLSVLCTLNLRPVCKGLKDI